MGKFEVYDYLVRLRLKGDDAHYSFAEIQRGMKDEGQSHNYEYLRRCVLQMFTDRMVESVLSTDFLNRTRRFRARLSDYMKSLHSSPMKRVDNIHLSGDETSPGHAKGDGTSRAEMEAQRW